MLRWLFKGLRVRSDYRAITKARVGRRIGRRAGHKWINRIFK